MDSHRLAAVLSGVVLVAGCTSGGDSEDDSAGDLVDAIGCTGFTADSEEIFVEEGDSCTVDGSEVVVSTFASNDARDSWLEFAREMGGLFLVGDGWIVSGDREVLDAIKADVGGELD